MMFSVCTAATVGVMKTITLVMLLQLHKYIFLFPSGQEAGEPFLGTHGS